MPHPYASDEPVDELWLVRHGETEWSRNGRHTSTTELPLTEDGVRVAGTLRERLEGVRFDLVLTSPRAARPSYGGAGRLPRRGRRRRPGGVGLRRLRGDHHPEIRETVPGWTVWTHPCPGGETAAAGVRPARPRRTPGARAGRPVPGVRPRPRHPGADRALAGPAGRRGPVLPAGHVHRLGPVLGARDPGRSSAGTPDAARRVVSALHHPARRGGLPRSAARSTAPSHRCGGPRARTTPGSPRSWSAPTGLPTYLPWPMSPGWSISDFGCVAAQDEPAVATVTTTVRRQRARRRRRGHRRHRGAGRRARRRGAPACRAPTPARPSAVGRRRCGCASTATRCRCGRSRARTTTTCWPGRRSPARPVAAGCGW